MFEYIKHISPKTKILFLAFILILVPGAVISYLSFLSIDQRTDNIKAKYVGTVSLIRDKIESEVFRLEADLRNSVIESLPEKKSDSELKIWLRNIKSENPAFKNLFIVNGKGGLISSMVSLGWNKTSGTIPLIRSKADSDFDLAENAEFKIKNYTEAIRLYRKCLNNASSSYERALIMSRIGRCYYKLRKYKKGIDEYKKVLEFGNNKITIGKVPASIVALSQIADGYDALQDNEEQYKTIVRLYQQLLDHPWDILGGEYLYYLKSAGAELRKLEPSHININSDEKNIEDLKIQEESLLEQIRFIELINQNVLYKIESDLSRGSPSEFQSFNISVKGKNSTFQIGYFKLPSAFQQSQLSALGYEFDRDYSLSSFIPEILSSVELGSDVLVGILSDKDSLLYLQQNQSITNYLAAENFSQIFTNWKVALFDPDGESIEQLTGRERQLYLILFAGIIVVMLIGIVVMVRAVIHESEVSRMKSEFVSNVSHELKTPLALIRMFGETLDAGIVTDEKKRREFYGIIRKESERLSHLINNVLDFSRMDSGSKKYNFEEADLVKVIKSSLEAYKFHVRDNGFEIQSEMPEESMILKIDKDAISQAFLNLLSNAVKYSEENKYIQVEVSKYSNSATISVKDSGIGIAAEELKKIFDKFYRVPNVKGKESRGSGLGLALAKNIVEAHGGTIEVESEIDKGSKFTISIPLEEIPNM